jgi:hypothetical protein
MVPVDGEEMFKLSQSYLELNSALKYDEWPREKHVKILELASSSAPYPADELFT